MGCSSILSVEKGIQANFISKEIVIIRTAGRQSQEEFGPLQEYVPLPGRGKNCRHDTNYHLILIVSGLCVW
jgi:hypothetical protein